MDQCGGNVGDDLPAVSHFRLTIGGGVHAVDDGIK